MFAACWGANATHDDFLHHLTSLLTIGVDKIGKFACEVSCVFKSAICPIACFAAGHRTVHKADLHRVNVEQRQLLCMVVGPPTDISWDDPWHAILHAWNARVSNVCQNHGLEDWAAKCLEELLESGHVHCELAT